MSFDLTNFVEIGKWLFDTGIKLFKSFDFNFGGYTLNGLAILIGAAVLSIVVWGVGRILQ